MAKTKHTETLHYELLCLVSNNYTEEEAGKIMEEVKNMVEKQDGSITYSDFWGKRKLAYPIKKNYHGYYFIFEFDAPAKNMPTLNKNLTLNDKLLRHLNIKKDKKVSEKEAKQAQEKAQEKNTDQTEESESSEENSNQKNENIDEKLDGILDANDLVK